MSIGYKPRGNVVNYDSGNTDKTITKSTGMWISLLITNDAVVNSSNNLTIKVNDIIMTVKPGETMDEDFENFNRVVITATNSYRIWLRE